MNHLRISVGSEYDNNQLPTDFRENTDAAADEFWGNGTLEQLHQVAEDDKKIIEATDKLTKNLLEKTWSWPKGLGQENQDFSRYSAEQNSQIEENLIELQIEIISSGIDMITTSVHP